MNDPYGTRLTIDHHGPTTYFKTRMFCPFCVSEDVWQHDSGGDHYAGPNIRCLSCGARFENPCPGDAFDEDDAAVVAKLTAARGRRR